MRISLIKLNTYKANFASTNRTTYFSESEGQFVLPTYDRKLSLRVSPNIRMICSNSTNFFRRDLNWDDIGNVFDKQFPRGKVNIYDFACSDGSEAYSIIIALIEQLGEKKASRFFPIQASDIDPEIVKMAQSGKIIATEEDILSIEGMVKKGDIKKYFSKTPVCGGKYILSPKEILTKNVIFKQEGINQGLDKINKDEQNIIFARNFWKYLSSDDLVSTSWKLGQKANDKTLLFIGNFDLQKNKDPFFLEALGFSSHCDKDENILDFKDHYKNLATTKDEKTWKSYVISKYSQYIPSYLKTT